MRATMLAFALCAIASAIAVHLMVIQSMPSFIMSRTTSSLKAAGLKENKWTAAPRIMPLTQKIVRSSPDLFYAVCLLDLTSGQVQISVPLWPAYGSLSVFDDTSENVHISNLQGNSQPLEIIVALPGQTVSASSDTTVVFLPGPSGIAIVRRLAPDEASHKVATELVATSLCAAR
ncbi:MAG: DUF1254 domain-containing protein [Marinibacterium sp.]|nr:DUF1254 domain-containing protein [Marinibacterium sp.]